MKFINSSRLAHLERIEAATNEVLGDIEISDDVNIADMLKGAAAPEYTDADRQAFGDSANVALLDSVGIDVAHGESAEDALAAEFEKLAVAEDSLQSIAEGLEKAGLKAFEASEESPLTAESFAEHIKAEIDAKVHTRAVAECAKAGLSYDEVPETEASDTAAEPKTEAEFMVAISQADKAGDRESVETLYTQMREKFPRKKR